MTRVATFSESPVPLGKASRSLAAITCCINLDQIKKSGVLHKTKHRDVRIIFKGLQAHKYVETWKTDAAGRMGSRRCIPEYHYLSSH